MQFSGKIQEGDQLAKEAQSHLKPKVLQLRFKPNLEAALPLFEKAAVAYQLGNGHEQAKNMYRQVADGYIQLNYPYKAGKFYEEAAKMAKELKQWKEVAKFSEQAALGYFEAGKFSAGAEALSTGARYLAGNDSGAACELYFKAIRALEAGDRMSQTAQIYRDGINAMIEAQLWDGASSLLNKFSQQLTSDGRTDSHNKALLGAIVVMLHSGNVENAYESYQHHFQTDAEFARSEEAQAAMSLLQAYSTQSVESIKQVVKDYATFLHLETPVARIAKKLPSQDPATLPKISFGIDQIQPNQGQQIEEEEEELDIT
eukprot:TRINITY_DN1593_c0_g1_i1.p1 TRINITY_DN1593_c0_g1~~TRINITY_DN1593_c0_g1_i1.p1  ORF type:complete len:334 (-),score=52.75 TRINITY_DN1593_c0_g1_i1:550-1494(-)